MFTSKFIPALLAGALLAAASGAASAAEHRVQMLNRGDGGAMVFVPAVVKAKVGDTVRYVATDPGHNAEIIVGMAPDGVAAQRGVMSKDFVIKITKPGLYGVKCAPHYGMGMVSLIDAGKGTNAEAAKATAAKAPGIARKRFAAIFAARP